MGSSGTQNRLKDALNGEGEPYLVVIFGLTNTLFSCKSYRFSKFRTLLAFREFGCKSEWQKPSLGRASGRPEIFLLPE